MNNHGNESDYSSELELQQTAFLRRLSSNIWSLTNNPEGDDKEEDQTEQHIRFDSDQEEETETETEEIPRPKSSESLMENVDGVDKESKEKEMNGEKDAALDVAKKDGNMTSDVHDELKEEMDKNSVAVAVAVGDSSSSTATTLDETKKHSDEANALQAVNHHHQQQQHEGQCRRTSLRRAISDPGAFHVLPGEATASQVSPFRRSVSSDQPSTISQQLQQKQQQPNSFSHNSDTSEQQEQQQHSPPSQQQQQQLSTSQHLPRRESGGMDPIQESVHLEQEETEQGLAVPVVAFEVNPDEEEQIVRRRIIDEAVVAQVVSFGKGNSGSRHWTKRHVWVCFGIVVAIGLVVGVSVGVISGKQRQQQYISSDIIGTTLDNIMKLDKIRCGITDFPLFYQTNETTGEKIGFEIDLCRAIAAVTLGDSDKYELFELPLTDRFMALSNHSIDVYLRASESIERDVYEPSAQTGFTFSDPFYYGKVVFGGKAEHVECADAFNTQGNCSDLMVCMGQGLIYEQILRNSFLPRSHIYSVPLTGILQAYAMGECNVAVSIDYDISKYLVVDQIFGPGHVVGNTVLAYERLSMVTREDDPVWSTMVNWVLQALLVAEENGITRSTATSSSSSFTNLAHNMSADRRGELLQQVVAAAVGNYGEIYDAHYERFVPREVNKINTNATTGIFLPPDFTSSSSIGPEPIPGGTIDRITNRGYLICGVQRQPGFANFDESTGEWTGIDVDYCCALAGSIFFGHVAANETIRFVELSKDGHKNGVEAYDSLPPTFAILANGTVDVISGARIDHVADEFVTFSQPYYYSNERLGEVHALATNQDDPQWSSFSHWIVASTIYAEAQSITKDTSNSMPTVGLFGINYHRMFRDAILSVGNYHEIYSKNLESIISRSGLNLLNDNTVGPLFRPFPFEPNVERR